MQCMSTVTKKKPVNRFERRIEFSNLPRRIKKSILEDKKVDRYSRMNPSRMSDWDARRRNAAEKHARNIERVGGCEPTV